MNQGSSKTAKNLELRDEIMIVLVASLIPLTTLFSMIY